MPTQLDTQHVRNVGGFFSQHYLERVLPGDLRDIFARWRARGGPTPMKRLSGLSERYFRALGEVRRRREEVSRRFHGAVLEALGYEVRPTRVELGDGGELGVTVAESLEGRAYLWIGEAAFPESEEGSTPLESRPLGATRETRTWRELLEGGLFRQAVGPRWLMLLGGGDVLLLEREKWCEGKFLHVELGAMLGRRTASALRAAAGLLHRDVLVGEGACVLDRLDERSHKHAHAVSKELKGGVRAALELLGNEALWHRRERGLANDEPGLGRRLSEECLTYLYRLLIVFYMEARGGALGGAPMAEEAYREGLSVESLRGLELAPLRTKAARDGYYFHETLTLLFRVIHEGWPKRQRRLAGGVDLSVAAQGGRLFDARRTPLLSGVKLRNHALQRVIRSLSLSREGGRGAARGRISYATLGINQLGSVYEGLLSYRGMIARERLYEVQRPRDEGGRVYLVPASRVADYREEELRRGERGELVEHGEGAFLFRLVGRGRERSASFYTPEVLTRCLTKHTLSARLKGLRADEILALTVCEPAMGSGAFLGEAASQLATAYLARKQAELGRRVGAEEYGEEHARARYHFVTRRCYGVDLNPLATELGKVSLWLGALQRGVEAPYLDVRVRAGNSLIGARREVYAAEELTGAGWREKAPRRLGPRETRPKGHVYHFLTADSGMAPYERDGVARRLCPEEVKALRAWRRAMRRPYRPEEVKRLERLSERIDALWEEHRGARRRVLARLRQPIAVWGQAPPEGAWRGPEECERIASELTRPGSAYARLRAVMDLWCRLWTWPIERAEELPSRGAWMTWVEELLEGGAGGPSIEPGPYHHWELEFCEVFERGGFDVIVGNPPWIKLRWEEGGVLGELEPLLVLRRRSAQRIGEARGRLLLDEGRRSRYLSALGEDCGALKYLSARHNYPLLEGVQTNLYKCFFERALALLSERGAAGFIHQSGMFSDARGGRLRRLLSRQLILKATFVNKLKLFPEVKDEVLYDLTVLRGAPASVGYVAVANLLHPSTLDGSFEHDGAGPAPGIKSALGEWELRPHRSRLVPIDEDTLALFQGLYEGAGGRARGTRVPTVHCVELLRALRRFTTPARTLAGLGDKYYCTECFHETNQRADGTIVRRTHRPRAVSELIVSGPNFFVGNPLYKQPNEGCRHNQDYAAVDLTLISSGFIPRSNYARGRGVAEYHARLPRWRAAPVTERYRHIHREMVGPVAARTLIPAIIPPGVAHVNTAFSIAFEDDESLLAYSGMAHSIVVDFLVKTSGMGHVNRALAERLPLASPRTRSFIAARTLRLNCLTEHYAALWNAALPERLRASAKSDPRTAGWEHAPRAWSWGAPLRTAYARRQALVELDALAALSLGMTLEELQLIYRVQFPVLRQYEAETFYDRRGKIVFTVNRGLSGVGVTRRQWREIKDAGAGARLPEWAKDGGGAFEPPFDRCARESDLAEAYAYFEGLIQRAT